MIRRVYTRRKRAVAMIDQAQIAIGNYLQMTGRLLHLAVLIRELLEGFYLYQLNQ